MINAKKNKLAVLVGTALLLIITVSALAATIKLKNGRVLNGTIAERTKNEIKVVTSYGVITFTPAEIDTINGRKLSAPAAAKKSPAKTTAVTSKTTPKKVQKTVAPVKKKVTPKKAVATVAEPVVTADTTTPVNVTASTETVPVSAPARSSIPLLAIIFGLLVIVVTVVYVMAVIKRNKNRSNY
ncbi:MAG: hypothetical protein PHD29_00240 [bacterium]|nr:hypothetical protein [bacterium]MDD5354441.1 hypothetical protein [bacterium]MDD5756091.1 hypothetical protein [bacterium]